MLNFPPLLLATSPALGIAFCLLVPGSDMLSAVAISIAVLLATGGISMDRWAQSSLRQARTAVHPSHPTEAIMSSGAFASSRNPIDAAQGMLLAALGFAIRSPLFFVAMVPWFLVIRLGVVAREELYLQRKFGDDCTCYLVRVRRWI